jgi:hypothetical protein
VVSTLTVEFRTRSDRPPHAAATTRTSLTPKSFAALSPAAGCPSSGHRIRLRLGARGKPTCAACVDEFGETAASGVLFTTRALLANEYGRLDHDRGVPFVQLGVLISDDVFSAPLHGAFADAARLQPARSPRLTCFSRSDPNPVPDLFSQPEYGNASKWPLCRRASSDPQHLSWQNRGFMLAAPQFALPPPGMVLPATQGGSRQVQARPFERDAPYRAAVPVRTQTRPCWTAWKWHTTGSPCRRLVAHHDGMRPARTATHRHRPP